MLRLATVCVLVLGLLLIGARSSRADVVLNGFCFSGPANTLVPCGGTGPTATPAPFVPVKQLSVSGGSPGPADTTSYNVTIVSQLSCFALNEPTNVYALGSQSAAAFYETFPVYQTSNGPFISVLPSQQAGSGNSGTAILRLEVANNHVGPEGLNVKAVWPVENVERIVNVIPPAPTSTPAPGEPTNTPTATATSTPTPTSTPTGTSPPTNTPVPTTTPAPRAVDVTACVDPSIMFGSTFGNDSPTLRGSTTPGAVCTGNVEYLDGTFPPTFDGSARIANSQGLVAFPWAESSSSGGGIARVQCTYGGGPVATACTGFLILQRSDSGLSIEEQQALLQSIQGLVHDPAVCNAYFGP